MLTGSTSLIVWDFITTNRKDNMTKSIKAEYLPGGAKRQEILDQVPEYLQKPGADQATKHYFCMNVLKLTETEYLEALNKATNGGLVEARGINSTPPAGGGWARQATSSQKKKLTSSIYKYGKLSESF